MKPITRYFLIAVAVIVIGAVTKPSESEHRSKLTSEIVRHNLGDYGRDLRKHRQMAGTTLTRSEYVKENYDINIDDYWAFSLGKVKDKATGEERVVSIAALGKVIMN